MAAQTSPPRSIFSPRLWGAHALVIVFVTGAVMLGVWQYESSQQDKQDQVAQLVHAKPKSFTDLIGPNDSFPWEQIGRPVTVSGIWMSSETIFIDGMERGSEVGYWAVTPVLVEDTGSAVYVVRGWTPEVASAPPAPRGHVTVTGWLQPSDWADVADDRKSDNVFPQLDIADLISRTSYDLYSAYMVRSPVEDNWPASSMPVNDGATDVADVPAPQLPEPEATTGLRNLLYAIEWWLFGVFAIYVWWRYVRDTLRRPDDEDDEGDEGDDATPPPEKAPQESHVPSEA
ncbi:cytochrome oxidase assembly protein ShyY1 [Nocardioides luteus]|uniref:SURF1-like protein n=1 Tax=Nocardioides luteus TaxID=1844 RepID=A0ABQ5SPX2_9ACTN|nr:SURF1 family protein [Nocardioides luteus]MDR7313034.1 cytochrome oxidase assembly protein ShyY1 [Nocardioides luteus]GGR44539.1 SURF1-like protein [Nocardioides luteus]GLJ66095.1 SURF1-like protein [Nocardioides luteus]